MLTAEGKTEWSQLSASWRGHETIYATAGAVKTRTPYDGYTKWKPNQHKTEQDSWCLYGIENDPQCVPVQDHQHEPILMAQQRNYAYNRLRACLDMLSTREELTAHSLI